MTTAHEDDTVARLRSAARAQQPVGQVDLGRVRLGGEALRRRRSRVRGAIASGAGALVVVGAVVIGGGLLGPTPGPGPDGTTDPAAVLSLLDRSRAPADELPQVLTGDARPDSPGAQGAGEGEVLSVTSRLVLEQDGVSYYAGTDGAGQVCLVVHLQVSDAAGTSCASPQRPFERYGLWVQVGGPAGDSATGLLVPDDAGASDLERMTAQVVGRAMTEVERLSTNLYARTTGTAPADAEDPEAGTGAAAAPEDLLRVLARPAGPEDEASSSARPLASDPGGPAVGTTRYLGTVDGTEFWVSASGDGGVCLLFGVPTEQRGGSSCTDAKQLMSGGLAVAGAAGDEQTPLTVVLVPDAWTAAGGGDGSELNRIGLEEEDNRAPNLYVRPADT